MDVCLSFCQCDCIRHWCCVCVCVCVKQSHPLLWFEDICQAVHRGHKTPKRFILCWLWSIHTVLPCAPPPSSIHNNVTLYLLYWLLYLLMKMDSLTHTYTHPSCHWSRPNKCFIIPNVRTPPFYSEGVNGWVQRERLLWYLPEFSRRIILFMCCTHLPPVLNHWYH